MIFKALGNGHYRLADAQHGIELDVDRLRRDRNGELVGELAVACSLLGAKAIDGVMSVGTFNLSSIRSRQDRARALAERARTGGKVDFVGLLEELCQRVLAGERDGTPVITLRDLPKPTPDEEFDIQGFRVPAKHAAILFGDGGSLKSYQLLYVLGHLALEGRSVCLLDWELDAFTHRRRIEQLFGVDMPAVRYVRCDRPLVHQVDYVARVVHRHAIEYAGFDSCGFATDGAPEAAEAALGYFRAVRQLGIGSLHIAHTTKNGDNTEHRPFGSAFWHNSARSTWFAKRAGETPDGRAVSLGLFHRKANLGPLRQPIAFEVEFDQDRTTFHSIDAASCEGLVGSLPLWGRIRAELRGGAPQTLASLAEQLGVKVDSVEKAVKRRTDLFTKVPGTDGIRRIALVERRAS